MSDRDYEVRWLLDRSREKDARLQAINDLAAARLRNLAPDADPHVLHDLTEIVRLSDPETTDSLVRAPTPKPTAPSCGHAAYRNGENCINDGCYNTAADPGPAPEPVKPPATCQCFHAPEQHSESGCGVVAIMSGRCPCEWNGARTPAAGTAPKGGHNG